MYVLNGFRKQSLVQLTNRILLPFIFATLGHKQILESFLGLSFNPDHWGPI
jgi:hypothetical protein